MNKNRKKAHKFEKITFVLSEKKMIHHYFKPTNKTFYFIARKIRDHGVVNKFVEMIAFKVLLKIKSNRVFS